MGPLSQLWPVQKPKSAENGYIMGASVVLVQHKITTTSQAQDNLEIEAQ